MIKAREELCRNALLEGNLDYLPSNLIKTKIKYEKSKS